jgi:ribosomal protein L14E/L6E/L27E
MLSDRRGAGPFAVNGVPVRRVNQAYVIATKTKVDISAVNAAKFDDAYFKRPVKAVAKKSEQEFFATEEAVRPQIHGISMCGLAIICPFPAHAVHDLFRSKR